MPVDFVGPSVGWPFAQCQRGERYENGHFPLLTISFEAVGALLIPLTNAGSNVARDADGSTAKTESNAKALLLKASSNGARRSQLRAFATCSSAGIERCESRAARH